MTTTTSSSSSTFLLPTTQFHHRRQRTTGLCTKSLTLTPLAFPPPSRLIHRRFLPPYLSLSRKKIGGIKKTWSDISSLNYWVVKDYYGLVKSVNALEPQFQNLFDEQLQKGSLE